MNTTYLTNTCRMIKIQFVCLCVCFCRSGGDWGGWADIAAAQPAEWSFGQNLFRQGATRSAGEHLHFKINDYINYLNAPFIPDSDCACCPLSFRSVECFSYDQMGGLSRPSPWQQTTRNWCSICTSPTDGHLDPTGCQVLWNVYKNTSVSEVDMTRCTGQQYIC